MSRYCLSAINDEAVTPFRGIIFPLDLFLAD